MIRNFKKFSPSAKTVYMLNRIYDQPFQKKNRLRRKPYICPSVYMIVHPCSPFGAIMSFLPTIPVSEWFMRAKAVRGVYRYSANTFQRNLEISKLSVGCVSDRTGGLFPDYPRCFFQSKNACAKSCLRQIFDIMIGLLLRTAYGLTKYF